MNLFKIVVAMLAAITLFACQSKPTSDATAHASHSTAQAAAKPKSVADLEQQILAVHDSVMLAMSELMRLKKTISQQLAEQSKQPASANAHQRGLAVKAALEQADQSMMNWMHHYNGDTLATLTEQQALAYLQEEQQRVNAMSELMRKSITDAQAYLKR
ncbi:hypothetical protein M0L20_24700 [Spirosoma sp. RP8]|uniref:Viral A-type inclusion protein n=1 Tax=Spirosoma liriopis TaxID=2937440 RepID=A0ABT0HUA1_9BACT|nr:hypothetical protein [Spirosoma liriopis]MCK8495095.1 hypothetical protein [Spirosoma liriopis]